MGWGGVGQPTPAEEGRLGILEGKNGPLSPCSFSFLSCYVAGTSYVNVTRKFCFIEYGGVCVSREEERKFSVESMKARVPSAYTLI